MKFLIKFLILLLIFSLCNFYLPRPSFSQVGNIEPEISKHAPEMRSSSEQNIPVEGTAEKRKTWIWWLVGALVVGGAIGLAAAAAGGGGGSNGGNGGNSGSVTLGW